jgi:hypothetical protein
MFENAALLREILNWGRDSSRQVQNDLSLKRATFSNSGRNSVCSDKGA